MIDFILKIAKFMRSLATIEKKTEWEQFILKKGEVASNITSILTLVGSTSIFLGFFIEFIIFASFDIYQIENVFSVAFAMKYTLIFSFIFTLLFITYIGIPAIFLALNKKETDVPISTITLIIILIIGTFFINLLFILLLLIILLLIIITDHKTFIKWDLKLRKWLFAILVFTAFFCLVFFNIKTDKIKKTNDNYSLFCKKDTTCVLKYKNDKVTIIENDGKYTFWTTDKITKKEEKIKK
jgi:hypothetical protein